MGRVGARSQGQGLIPGAPGGYRNPAAMVIAAASRVCVVGKLASEARAGTRGWVL